MANIQEKYKGINENEAIKASTQVRPAEERFYMSNKAIKFYKKFLEKEPKNETDDNTFSPQKDTKRSIILKTSLAKKHKGLFFHPNNPESDDKAENREAETKQPDFTELFQKTMNSLGIKNWERTESQRLEREDTINEEILDDSPKCNFSKHILAGISKAAPFTSAIFKTSTAFKSLKPENNSKVIDPPILIESEQGVDIPLRIRRASRLKSNYLSLNKSSRMNVEEQGNELAQEPGESNAQGRRNQQLKALELKGDIICPQQKPGFLQRNSNQPSFSLIRLKKRGATDIKLKTNKELRNKQSTVEVESDSDLNPKKSEDKEKAGFLKIDAAHKNEPLQQCSFTQKTNRTLRLKSPHLNKKLA